MEQRKRLFNESDALLRSAEQSTNGRAQAKGDARLTESYRENEDALIRMADEQSLCREGDARGQNHRAGSGSIVQFEYGTQCEAISARGDNSCHLPTACRLF
jgi:hypothetical protein